MEDKIEAEFTLFVCSPVPHLDKLIQAIRDCFIGSITPTQTPFEVYCCPCCPSQERSKGEGDTAEIIPPKHAEHFLIFRVPRSRLIQVAALLRPELKQNVNRKKLLFDFTFNFFPTLLSCFSLDGIGHAFVHFCLDCSLYLLELTRTKGMCY